MQVINRRKNGQIYRYYNIQGDRFVIPISEVTESITDCILQLIKEGYAMTVIQGNCYCIYNIAKKTQGVRELSVCRNTLYQWLHYEAGVHYFTSMKFKQYMQNPSYQEGVDYVLRKGNDSSNSVEGWSIVLVAEEDSLKFVEVLNSRCIDG